ncbi:MAG: class I SAM-dependent RNA methyltransferase [Lentisphaeria bacterium]
MLYTGQNLKLSIEDIAFGGNGVARTSDGMAVFVPYSAPGDELRVEITKVKKRFAEAKIIEIIKPSQFRVSPKTEKYQELSISQYEHICYEKQLEIKEKQLIDQVTRIGHLSLDNAEKLQIVPSPLQYNYRNKVTLHPARYSEEWLDYGFIGHDNKTVIWVNRCELANEKINSLIPKINKMKWGKKNSTRKTPLDCTIRCTTENEAHAYFGVAPESYPWLVEKVNGFEVRVPLGSFFQVNVPVAEKLFTTIAQWVNESGAKAAIDSYCGVGIFGLHLPAEMEVHAFDIDEQAMKAAQLNTLQAGLINRRFYCGPDKNIFGDVIKACKPSETILILDPPRTGCHPAAIDQIVNAKFESIIMVSCNPATLARDLQLLCEKGNFQISKIQAFDMFPQTAHFEAAVMLSKK